ncbi:MAG: hypothetical protein J3Q66DRAFT_156561 [Benniella sp.]|nr:MAG: hypothetical protein J3Q66DRAFT_156561 [Benniella sp.]
MCKEGNAYHMLSNEQQSSGDKFEDGPVFERMLEQELVLDDLPHGEANLQCDAYPRLDFLEFQNAAQGEDPLQWPQPIVNSHCTRNSKSRVSFEINNPDGEQPRSETRCVLDEQRLTIRDQIHKMGYEIRVSRAASIPRFGITAPSSLDNQ